MNIIELERWKPSEDDPRKLKYAGQPAAEEVFQELKQRLEGMGYLPDEYFLMDDEWKNGREIPRGADVFCTTDYGESEGVYLDVYLKWHEDGKPIIKNFITGKTLGESGDDLDRMFLISSAITKAFHGGEATHARYMKVGGVEESTGGSVVHLSQEEQRTIIEALVEQRERQENAMSQTEQLLRRMTGSITGYMDAVGQRPLHLSDYDKAALAIRDRELAAFKELWPKATDHADELLVETAAHASKAVFFSLYFGGEAPLTSQFANCFATSEIRTRTVTDTDQEGNEIEVEQTYTVAVPIEDMDTVYSHIAASLGVEITEEQKSNADNVYSLIKYGYPVTGEGGSFDGADVPFVGADGFCSPVGANWRSIVTSEFGGRLDPITGQRDGHTGMDLAVPTGTPIRAALGGTVTLSRYNGSYGNCVMIDHGNGLTTLYGHNSRLLVQPGQTVQAGDVVSLSGATGRVTGPHLHFEVRVNGQRTNPRYYLP